MKKHICIAILLLIGVSKANSQATVGLIKHDSGTVDNGYVLFGSLNDTKNYLIDKCGREVHQWHSLYTPGASCYLLEDGSLLRANKLGNTTFTAGGSGGLIQKLDWNSNYLWTYFISTPFECQHHDIRILPNGNVLAIVWESESSTEAISQGRNPSSLPDSTLWSEKIIEIHQTSPVSGTIVWEWHLWDHLVQDYDLAQANYGTVADHPELVNLNYNGGAPSTDWIHMNGIDYNPQLDQIILSCHNQSEFWVIDHSTTSAEAATHAGGNSGRGGDLLYRWGNPQAYDHGTIADRKLYKQHNVKWITPGKPHAGDIMIFNNGLGRGYSSIDIIHPPVNASGVYDQSLPYAPANLSWTYEDSIPNDFYSAIISGAQMLSNGNVEICSGVTGKLFEVDSMKHKVWEYISPIDSSGPITQGDTSYTNPVFRAEFYYADYPGFSGQTLTAGQPIELNPIPNTCTIDTGTSSGAGIKNAISPDESIVLYPNPAGDEFKLKIGNADFKNYSVKFFDLEGREIFIPSNFRSQELVFNSRSLKDGLYLISINDGKNLFWKKIIISK